jgi:protein-tyrosine phosphatase
MATRKRGLSQLNDRGEKQGTEEREQEFSTSDEDPRRGGEPSPQGEKHKGVQYGIGGVPRAAEETPKAKGWTSLAGSGPERQDEDNPGSGRCKENGIRLVQWGLLWGELPALAWFGPTEDTATATRGGGKVETEVQLGNSTQTFSVNGVLMRTGETILESSLLAPALKLFRAVKKAFVRLAHPLRRRALKRRLAHGSRVENIMVICLGNICRSPYGHSRLIQLSSDADDLNVRSAGLMGPNRPSPAEAQSAAAKLGLDLTSHNSRLLTRELAAWADLIIVMSPHQVRVVRADFDVPDAKIVLLGDLDPETPDRRDIPDPLDRSEDYFLEVYDRMDRCLDAFYSLIRIPS